MQMAFQTTVTLTIPVMGARPANTLATTVPVYGYEIAAPSLPLPDALQGFGSLTVVASRSALLPMCSICEILLPQPVNVFDVYFGAHEGDYKMEFPLG